MLACWYVSSFHLFQPTFEWEYIIIIRFFFPVGFELFSNWIALTEIHLFCGFKLILARRLYFIFHRLAIQKAFFARAQSIEIMNEMIVYLLFIQRHAHSCTTEMPQFSDGHFRNVNDRRNCCLVLFFSLRSIKKLNCYSIPLEWN